jgi:uncharacterized protein YdhG (YjbR/CyaY superfamily)
MWAAAVLPAFFFLAGCGTAIKYSYEPRASFPDLKTYRWAKADQVYYWQDPLLESNVRFLVDRDLEKKRLALKPDKADLIIWMAYELDYYSYSYNVRMLTLNISRADSNELVWRGTASGVIQTDAASGELKKVVEGLLANFPPK